MVTLKSLKTFILSHPLSDEHMFSQSYNNLGLFYKTDFLYFYLSNWFEVGGAWLEKGDVMYFSARIRNQQNI